MHGQIGEIHHVEKGLISSTAKHGFFKQRSNHTNVGERKKASPATTPRGHHGRIEHFQAAIPEKLAVKEWTAVFVGSKPSKPTLQRPAHGVSQTQVGQQSRVGIDTRAVLESPNPACGPYSKA
ncbi:hypothetical protein GX50_08033 [[Emmonsia] crescens]|uniref:Uncharacterized protein n=1 Tax=[Emmonsia] crescens TaxID=73230 RepID=A0A2B7Z781_9EURO|nr:hypothetical protein GX50_08033 [Emmonsia crescens]